MTDITSRQTEITSDHKPWTATNTRAPAVPKSVTHCIELSKNHISKSLRKVKQLQDMLTEILN